MNEPTYKIHGIERRQVKKELAELKETDEERKNRLAKAEIERKKANGLKEFFYGENSVWAINQKNADKKARTLLLGLLSVGGSASQFEEDTFKLINSYVNEGLSKPDLVRKMKWITGSCEMS